ncbi:MAG: pilus assembly protein PilN [Gammaproteobacteria bacterium]|nr:MAG: pilus assembly protein PilN [Gammaproteobacteria bacterium]
MAHINLLPWRDQLRKERQQRFFVTMAVTAVIAGLVVGGVHIQIQTMIDFQKARNNRIQQEITAADKKIKEIQQLEKRKADLIARMQIIESLQASRPEAVHVFDELVQTIPDGVHLGSFAYKGKAVALAGVAQSNARVSTYMRNLDGSPWFGDPRLLQIQKKGAVRTFGLNVAQTSPNAKKEKPQ